MSIWFFCDPMDCSTLGFSALHRLSEFTQINVHWVSDAIQPSHPLAPPYLPALNLTQFSSAQFSHSFVSDSCDPMDCSTPGLPVHHQFPEFTQSTSIILVMPSNHLILCSPILLLPSVLSSIGFFPVSQLIASGGQRIGVSASVSVLPMNIQSWFPLGLTGLISLSKGLSRVFSNTTVQKHQLLGVQPSLWFSSHFHTWLLEKP